MEHPRFRVGMTGGGNNSGVLEETGAKFGNSKLWWNQNYEFVSICLTKRVPQEMPKHIESRPPDCQPDGQLEVFRDFVKE